MKTPEQVTADIRRRLEGRWHAHLVGDENAFPHSFPLGQVSSSQMTSDYASVWQQTLAWQEWAHTHDMELTYTTRLSAGATRQRVPTHAQVTSIDHAAVIVGEEWPQRLSRGRERLAALRVSFPGLADLARMVRHVDRYSDLDFQLLITVSQWFAQDPTRAQGLTPRQVPIPGVHAKWLQAHEKTVCWLLGIDDLMLLPSHPSVIHFTYLDPGHRAAGGRIHDSAAVGDRFTPDYLPQVVIISENKDTAVGFPELPGGISVEGVGKGGKTPASFDWLREAPLVVYWGDMDRDGYEILDGYRADFGRDVDSILMDPQAYATYEPFGTDIDKNGAVIKPGDQRPVPRLRPHERAVYEMLTDPQHTGHRRIEQERIPLAVALEHVTRLRRIS